MTSENTAACRRSIYAHPSCPANRHVQLLLLAGVQLLWVLQLVAVADGFLHHPQGVGWRLSTGATAGHPSSAIVTLLSPSEIFPVSDAAVAAASGVAPLVQSSDAELLSSVATGLADAAAPTSTLAAGDDPMKYAFMFPVMTFVAVLCQSAGIGGAALLSPIFLLVFPLLGAQYPLPSAAAAIACALLTECFGFASGLSGYTRRGLVDWDVASKFLLFSVPASLAGALIEPTLASQTTLLRGVYSALMIGLCAYLTFAEKPDAVPEDCMVASDDDDDPSMFNKMIVKSHSAADGTVFTYLEPSSRQTWKTRAATVSGASLTGVLGVGMGEVVLPQLVRKACMPLPVAAGTSVAVVVCTALTAAVVQFIALANELMIDSPGTSLFQALVQVVPWNVVQYTIPGAVIGGQIAPWLNANGILDEDQVERAIAFLFGVIGAAFALKVVVG